MSILKLIRYEVLPFGLQGNWTPVVQKPNHQYSLTCENNGRERFQLIIKCIWLYILGPAVAKIQFVFFGVRPNTHLDSEGHILL